MQKKGIQMIDDIDYLRSNNEELSLRLKSAESILESILEIKDGTPLYGIKYDISDFFSINSKIQVAEIKKSIMREFIENLVKDGKINLVAYSDMMLRVDDM